ncbi:uncharacterized protein DDB_G0283697 [Zingiber officinale]|uniref:uncharacterized protein DDB_G0283697 n=1 Tax=Zingiber officinale TaxID=94328 RepID=UPI001C4CA747|nr:uncharacterized protein DDB_G0283697 [Zingiber officinale]
MEIESEDGATIPIERDSSTEIGRRPGLLGLRRPSPPDCTVSRRHLSLRLVGGDSEDGPRVLFEVIGRNPVVVCGCGGRPRVYRKSEKGELRDGDRLSLSLKNLSFWVLRRRGAAPGAVDQKVVDAVARREKRTSERKKNERKSVIEAIGAEEEDLEHELAALDASQIDPVKEFGFLVKGHEFDRFPRHKIRSVKDWNWFLDRDDDDDEHEGIRRNRSLGKKKKGDDCEDEEWADVEDVVEMRNAIRPMYSTRSNRAKKPKKHEQEEEEEEDDDDHDDDDEEETLGGFIVDDGGDDEEDEGELEEEEEEEEFDGEDDEEDE